MSKPEYQPYDTALKSLLGDEVAEILPNLLPGSVYVSEENIEVDRTTLKTDLVYNILFRGLPHVLNMELQTDADADILKRLLRYHVGLHEKHNKPVISMVIYPFETTVPEPPFREKSGDETLLKMAYRVLRLWTMDAVPYIHDHAVHMYSLLPAMQHVTVPMLLQAIEEMKQHYNKRQFGDHLARFQKILWRSTTLSEEEKKLVQEELHVYDSLMDDSPAVQRAVRQTIMSAIEARFPALVELAQQHIVEIHDLNTLRRLIQRVVTVPNEDALRWFLSSNDAA